MIRMPRTLLLGVLLVTLRSRNGYSPVAQAQELRAGAAALDTPSQERTLWLGWLFGNNDNNDNDNDENDGNKNKNDSGNNGRGFFQNIWCLFASCEDNDDNDDSNPVTDLVKDILNTSDGSTPIRDAFNKSRDSETPLKDFLGELLDQPDSDTPVSDFIDRALNRSDAPFLDFIAALFNTTENTPISLFVRNLINGTESPLEDAITDWLGSEVFEEKDCRSTLPDDVPECAYNINGDAGVWICRTLYNPLDGSKQESTACAVPKFTLKNNDVCGSCNGMYPQQCPCACSVNDDDDDTMDGVYVTLQGATEKSCVNAKWALGARVTFESVRCVAAVDCPV